MAQDAPWHPCAADAEGAGEGGQKGYPNARGVQPHVSIPIPLPGHLEEGWMAKAGRLHCRSQGCPGLLGDGGKLLCEVLITTALAGGNRCQAQQTWQYQEEKSWLIMF